MNGTLRRFIPPSANVKEVPLTRTDYRHLDDVQRDLDASGLFGHFASLVVTSVRSGDYVEAAMRALRRGAAVYSVGAMTSRLLESRGIRVSAQAASVSKDLALDIHRGPVLIIGAQSIRPELADALRARDFEVVHVTCYATVAVELSDIAKDTLRWADVVFIGAPSAWYVARDDVGEHAWVVVPGATTGEIVRRDHGRVLEGWEPATREVLASLAI